MSAPDALCAITHGVANDSAVDSLAGIPGDCICPIGRVVMQDPVVAADGNSYDRAAIEAWFLQPGAPTSPLTGERLSTTAVFPNNSLRKTLEALQRKLCEAAPLQVLPAAVPPPETLAVPKEENPKEDARMSVEVAEPSKDEVQAAEVSPPVALASLGSDEGWACPPFPPIGRAGWLWKQSDVLGQWRRRWLVLGPERLRSFHTESPSNSSAFTQEFFLDKLASVDRDGARLTLRWPHNTRAGDTKLEADSVEEAALWDESIAMAMRAQQRPRIALQRFTTRTLSSPDDFRELAVAWRRLGWTEEDVAQGRRAYVVRMLKLANSTADLDDALRIARAAGWSESDLALARQEHSGERLKGTNRT